MRAFRLLAMADIAVGALLVVSGAISGIAVFRAPDGASKLLAGLLGAFVFLIGFTLIQSGIVHLRHPSRATARAVAVNFAVCSGVCSRARLES
jgi:hypothetical protein